MPTARSGGVPYDKPVIATGSAPLEQVMSLTLGDLNAEVLAPSPARKVRRRQGGRRECLAAGAHQSRRPVGAEGRAAEELDPAIVLVRWAAPATVDGWMTQPCSTTC